MKNLGDILLQSIDLKHNCAENHEIEDKPEVKDSNEDKFEFEKTLIISTGHLTEADHNRLPALVRSNDLFILDYPEGWIIYTLHQDLVSCRKELGLSSSFFEIIDFALENDCKFIQFDCDGPVYSCFKEFDW